YGRVNKWVAHFILAKLYLNAKVYTGQSRWQDVVTQTNAIINSAAYTLAPSFADNFVTNNQTSPEIIFAVPYDRVFMTGFNMHQATLHYANQITFQLQVQPWNGYAAEEAFYNSFEENDIRREVSFIVGPQYAPDG